MRTQHQPNAAMQETTPAPSPAPEMNKKSSGSCSVAGQCPFQFNELHYGLGEFVISFLLIFYAAYRLYLAWEDPKRFPENRNEEDERKRKAILDV